MPAKEDAQHKSRDTQGKELLEEDQKTKKAALDEGSEPPQTVPGYAGPSGGTVAGIPPAANVDKPEGAVIGEGGSLTLPTKYEYSAATYKKPSESDRIIGRALLEGDTFNGYHRKIIVQLDTGVTQEGAFNVFRNHFPDAIFEGFKAKGVTEEEATKLLEQWRKEGAVPGAPGAPAPEDDKKSKKDK